MKKNNSKKVLDSKDFAWILNSILRSWYVFTIVVPIMTAYGFYLNHTKKDKYISKIEILLKSNEVYDYQENLQNNLGFFSVYGDISSQKRILKSYDMIEKVLAKIDLTTSYFIKGIVNSKEFFRDIPFNVNAKLFNKSLMEKPINFKIVDNLKYSLKFKINGKEIQKFHFFDSTAITEFYNIKISLNPQINLKRIKNISSVNYYFVNHSKDYLINKIISNLNIENIEYTSLLVLKLSDEIPLRAKLILDTLGNEYLNYTLESQFKINDNTMNYINKQLKEALIVIDSLQYELQNIKNKKGITNVDKQTNEYFAELSLQEKNLNKLNLKIKTLDKLSKYLINQENLNILPPSLFFLDDDQYLTSSINLFYENQIQIVEMNNDFKKSHMSLNNLKEKIQSQRVSLLKYIENLSNALKSQIESLNKEILISRNKVKQLPLSQRDISSITRKLLVNEKLYEFLLEKRASTLIAKSGIVPQTKIIENARLISKISGKNIDNILKFFALGILFSILISLIIRIFFFRIRYVHELTDNTNFPVLGGINNFEYNNVLDITVKSKSVFVESLRNIRTSMNFLQTKKSSTCKSFLITSIHPGEGKTFCSINLARIFASSGKRVLLIDFDMHKPKIHKELKINNNIGNSTNLSSKTEFENSVTEIEANLFVISSGPIPPNPSELVLGDRVKDFIDFSANNYDYLFIDTPPVGLITDAIILSKLVDHSIFIMNTKYASKKGLDFVLDTSNTYGIDNISIILNGIKKNSIKYYYGKYGYGRYGQGYGYSYRYGDNYEYGLDKNND